VHRSGLVVASDSLRLQFVYYDGGIACWSVVHYWYTVLIRLKMALNPTSANDHTVNKVAVCSAIFAGFAYVGYSVAKNAFGRRLGRKSDDGKLVPDHISLDKPTNGGDCHLTYLLISILQPTKISL